MGGMDADDWAAWRAMTPEDHILGAFGYMMMSVRDLPPYAADESSLPFDAMAGCRDAFYLHARAVAEFFVTMPARDWTARDFLSTWTPPPGDLTDRLRRVWTLASKHVAHMSRDRVPDVDTFTPEDTSLAGLTAVAADCHRMLAHFVIAYGAAPDHPHVDTFTGYLRGPDVEAWVADVITLPPFRP